MLVCDAPVILSGSRPLLNAVVRWAKSNDVREIMVLEGVAAPNISEAGRNPIELSSDGPSDDHGYISQIKDVRTEAAPPAFISGISGGLLAACLFKWNPLHWIFDTIGCRNPGPGGRCHANRKLKPACQQPVQD